MRDRRGGLAPPRGEVIDLAMFIPDLIFKLYLLLLAGLVTLQDWRHMRISNRVSLVLLAPLPPLMVARWLSGAITVQAGQLVLAGWALCFLFQRLQVFGGGDVKVLMAVLAYFPDPVLAGWILIAILVGSLLMMVRYDRLASFRRMAAVLALAAMGTLPTVDDVRVAKTQRGQPLLFAPAIACAVYWLFVWNGHLL